MHVNFSLCAGLVLLHRRERRRMLRWGSDEKLNEKPIHTEKRKPNFYENKYIYIHIYTRPMSCILVLAWKQNLQCCSAKQHL